MSKRHLKRLAAPRKWSIKRKNITFIARPMPGPHPLDRCITINMMLKDILKYCKTTNEVKKILNSNGVIVDKKIRKDHKFPVGFMDIIDIPKVNESYRIIFDNVGKFKLEKIDKKDSENKICKIIGKKILKNGIIQLNLYDGKNIIVSKDNYKVGDSIVIGLKDNKVVSVLKLEKGAFVYIIEGNYAGSHGILEDFKGQNKSSTILLKTGDKKIETLKQYAFVVDKDVVKK